MKGEKVPNKEVNIEKRIDAFLPKFERYLADDYDFYQLVEEYKNLAADIFEEQEKSDGMPTENPKNLLEDFDKILDRQVQGDDEKTIKLIALRKESFGK